MATKQGEVSTVTFMLMLGTSLLYDGAQILIDLLHGIPVVGNIVAIVLTGFISVVAFMTFWLWYRMHGIRFNTAKKALTMGGGFIIELIPVINALPAWTLAVVLIYLTTIESKVLAKLPANVQKLALPVLKAAGVRPPPPPTSPTPTPASTSAPSPTPPVRPVDGIRRPT